MTRTMYNPIVAEKAKQEGILEGKLGFSRNRDFQSQQQPLYFSTGSLSLSNDGSPKSQAC